MNEEANMTRRLSATSMTIGVLLVVLGLYAFYYFIAATVAAVFILAGILIAGGVFHAVNAFSAGKWTTALLDVLAAVLYVFAGIVALRQPVITASMVTLVLSAMFVIQGIIRVVAALALRPRQWGWSMVNGVITVLL